MIAIPALKVRSMDIEVVSLDFAGTIVSKDFIDYFWFVSIPRALARVERIALYKAMKFVEREYESVPTSSIEWYLPSYWLKRFGLSHMLSYLIGDAIRLAEVYGDALRVIPIIRSFGIRLIISTNNPKIFVEPVLKMYGLDKYIEDVISCIDDVGEPKKTPKFYRYVAQRIGISPRRIVHVGDDPEYDGRAPIKIGMRSIVIDRSSRLRPLLYYVEPKLITSLEELLDLVLVGDEVSGLKGDR